MGTRNVTQIVHKGKTLLSHYCQWDGHPESAGAQQLAFLNGQGMRMRDAKFDETGGLIHFERKAFIANLLKVKHLSRTELQKLWEKAGADPKSEWVGMDVSEKFKGANPFLTRDCSGAEAFAGIQTGALIADRLDLEFVYDSLFCEWAYLLDLDAGTWQIFKGFNQAPLAPTERFYRPKVAYRPKPTEDNGYYGPKLWKTYALDKLPDNLDEAIAELKKEEEE